LEQCPFSRSGSGFRAAKVKENFSSGIPIFSFVCNPGNDTSRAVDHKNAQPTGKKSNFQTAALFFQVIVEQKGQHCLNIPLNGRHTANLNEKFPASAGKSYIMGKAHRPFYGSREL